MLVFLVLRVVKIHFWYPLEKFWKNREVASPGKNPFVAHACSLSNIFCHLYLKLPYFLVEPICKNTIFNDRIKEIVENADLHLKTNEIVLKILSYKRSRRIKQTWNYKNESLQCWNQQYVSACTLDFEYSNTRSLLTGYKTINWPERFFQLAALSTYGTFPIRRFLGVVHFSFAHIKTSVVKPSGTYITSNLLKSEKHQIKIFSLINSTNSFLERDMLRTHCWSCFDVFVPHWQQRSLMSSKCTTEKNISSWFCLMHFMI